MIKHISICSSVFLVFVFGISGFADEHFPFLAEVSKESVNVRSGPNTNFDKIDKLSKGTKVVVLDRSYEWFKVQPLASTKEYIRSDYLRIQDGQDFAIVIGDNVNVRSSASSDAASLGEVKKGTVVRILKEAEGNGWSLLSPLAGTRAWIHQDFLTEVSPDVPNALLIPVLVMPEIKAVEAEPPVKKIIETVSLQGKMELILVPLEGDIHYQIAIDDKSIYYLQDIPQIAIFANMVVAVEGIVIQDPDKKYTYPVLHINKISLVL